MHKNISLFLKGLYLYDPFKRECSSVGLERMLDRHEVGGSNPPILTTSITVLVVSPSSYIKFFFYLS